MKIFTLLTILNAAFLLCPLMAQERPVKESAFSIGYGVAFKKNNREGNTHKNGDRDTIIQSIPLIQFNYGRFSLGPQGFTIRVLATPNVAASAVLNWNGERYESVGMKGRKKSFFTGGLLKWNKLSLIMTRDIGNKSEGVDAQLSYNEVFSITNELLFRTSLFMEWHDASYANYYYGVTMEEATANRPSYRTGDYFNPGIGLMMIYKINKALSFMGATSFKYVPEAIRHSPTVKNNPLDAGGFVGLNYQF